MDKASSFRDRTLSTEIAEKLAKIGDEIAKKYMITSWTKKNFYGEGYEREVTEKIRQISSEEWNHVRRVDGARNPESISLRTVFCWVCLSLAQISLAFEI